MTETTYTIHDYDHRFDAGLAVMWNESDDQWPGTFTDGVPLTEERVREWMDRIEVLMRMIVVEDETGKVVGYGDLWDTAVRPKSCYVALLNVHPEHQGRSLARRMLVRMVDWAVENGYDRITIGTWPANLKAMPLYKKVGFFWKPDTTVYMENYLPAARLLPAAQDFFAHHDWYRTYDRELDQVEDGSPHPHTGNMKVYTLRWQDGDGYLETVFDRNAQALTGIETPEWAVFARALEPEPGEGICYPFEWEIRNKTDQVLPVRLQAEADEGIDLCCEAAFELLPGSSRILREEFRVEPGAPKYKGHHDDVQTPKVRTEVQLNGTPLELGTGLRYSPALELSLYPAEATLTPGVLQTVHIQLHNRTKLDLEGALELDLPEGLQADWNRQTFSAPPEGFAGLPVVLTAEKAGYYPLNVRAETDATGVLSPKLLPVTAPELGGWTAGQGDEELLLENDFFRVTAKSRAGEAVIFNKDLHEEDARLMEEIGPAYVPWDLHEQEYDLHLETTGGEAKAVMTVRSTRFPGVVVGREISVNASPLIKVSVWVTNNSEQAYEGLHLRPHVRVAHENRRWIAVPLKEGIVVEHGSQFGNTEEDLPKSLDRYSETWIGYDDQNRAIGMIWQEGRMKEILNEEGRHFMIFETPLLPGETRHIAPLYFYSGPGDWRAVQQAWRRLSGAAAARSFVTSDTEVRTHLAIPQDIQPLVTLEKHVETRLRVETTREYKLTGSINIRPPQGWKVRPAKMSFEIDNEHPKEMALRLEAHNEVAPGAYAGDIVFESQVYDRKEPFPVILLGDNTEKVSIRPLKDDRYAIENGAGRWTVAPGFHAGVTSWLEKDSDTNHLYTTYPEDGEWSWLKPAFGGIRPVLYDPNQDSGWPGKLHEENFTASPVSGQDELGLEWSGVRLAAEMRAERFKGLKVELDYLTLPGSNVLKTVFRMNNTTPVHRKVMIGWLTFIQVDGDYSNSVLHTLDYVRKRTPHSSWGLHDRWAAVENPETGRALAVVPAGGACLLQAIDMGVFGAHVFVREISDVPPSKTVEESAFFALAGTVEEARLYKDLVRERGKL